MPLKDAEEIKYQGTDDRTYDDRRFYGNGRWVTGFRRTF